MKIIDKTLHDLYDKTLIIEEYNGYKFIELGADRGKHYRLWLNRIKKEKILMYVECCGCKLKRLKPIIKETSLRIGKNPHNLIPIDYPNHHILIAKIPAGFRGGAKVLSVEPEPIKMFEYSFWNSKRGNLGKGIGLIIETDTDYMQVKGDLLPSLK